MCIDMCIDMRIDMCTDILTDMCTDMCIDMCIDLCIDMCSGMCIDMCTDMCMDPFRSATPHEPSGALRPFHHRPDEKKMHAPAVVSLSVRSALEQAALGPAALHAVGSAGTAVFLSLCVDVGMNVCADMCADMA